MFSTDESSNISASCVMIMNWIEELTSLMFVRWDRTFTRDFLRSESKCVVGSSRIMKLRFDAPRRSAMPNLSANAMLTCSPPLSDSSSSIVLLE